MGIGSEVTALLLRYCVIWQCSRSNTSHAERSVPMCMIIAGTLRFAQRDMFGSVLLWYCVKVVLRLRRDHRLQFCNPSRHNLHHIGYLLGVIAATQAKAQ